ncbi:uncharacterized protein LOC131882170 isoform X1 [Tigriopus californicus]|uniref:uncharacterized protein LOC131882170 isoform X1 n=1 Tax=Tigriopus californicus TaxID=6832 RepID=UPI0027DA99CF|nr:uncharacterized protein LOC131882170 isoform X1 [Tigriopus californicus]
MVRKSSLLGLCGVAIICAHARHQRYQDDLSEDPWWSSYQNSAPQETLDPSQEVTDRQDLSANPEVSNKWRCSWRIIVTHTPWHFFTFQALTIAALALGGLVGLGVGTLGFSEANNQRQEIRSNLASLTAEPLGSCATEQMIIARLNVISTLFTLGNNGPIPSDDEIDR